ncbi:GNAT family N-acetyltransferase [Mucilaginibacter mali]|uniref:GNAT family N-acetyltransferase n=1 Tax=Mucilaginibacter mali TaxID=2740462 RepID=A0A7D4Q6Q8_9SPHI|nr:GNAT family N-acetyltransferase [Mucilaginibacter mali]QKJ29451.1 GNAT family N-acetyltransferase [Mucilaginibacter mali]
MNAAQTLRTTSANPHFRTLVTQLDAELRLMYADLMDTYDQHNIIEHNDTVVIAYADSLPVGCGCFKPFDNEAVEVKRMFVHPDVRGRGISKLILGDLEAWARELGFTYTVLETGLKNSDAHHLYRKTGYVDIPGFGPYIDLEESICMRKSLNHD